MREFHSFLAPNIYRFIQYRQASQCWSDSSEKQLSFFDKYCQKYFPGVDTLTQEIVESWCCQRSTENRTSCETRIAPVRAFISYLNSRGLSSVQAPEPLCLEKKKYVPHAFTNEELVRFFRECDNIEAYSRKNSQVRKLTIAVFFRLLYSSGIRTNEARLLKRKDVNLMEGVLNIQQTKGYNQHYVVLHDTMLELLQKYDTAVDCYVHNREYFFPSSRNGHYNCSWVDHTFNQLWTKANPLTHDCAYDLRHNYAITNINQWIGQGFDFHDKLEYLSKSMGHTKIESTRYYYTIVPALSQILDEKTEESTDWIIPEVPSYEAFE